MKILWASLALILILFFGHEAKSQTAYAFNDSDGVTVITADQCTLMMPEQGSNPLRSALMLRKFPLPPLYGCWYFDDQTVVVLWLVPETRSISPNRQIANDFTLLQ